MLRNGRNLIMSVLCSCGKRLNQKFTMNQRVSIAYSFEFMSFFGQDWRFGEQIDAYRCHFDHWYLELWVDYVERMSNYRTVTDRSLYSSSQIPSLSFSFLFSVPSPQDVPLSSRYTLLPSLTPLLVALLLYSKLTLFLFPSISFPLARWASPILCRFNRPTPPQIPRPSILHLYNRSDRPNLFPPQTSIRSYFLHWFWKRW